MGRVEKTYKEAVQSDLVVEEKEENEKEKCTEFGISWWN